MHRAEQMPIRAIARYRGNSRNTVRWALKSEAALKYQREPKGPVVDAVEPQSREPLQRFPEVPAMLIVNGSAGVRLLWGAPSAGA